MMVLKSGSRGVNSMDVRNTAAESARICHELLVRQGKGLSYCTVLAVLPDMESDVILKTDKKLPSADGIVLEIFVHKNGALNILEFSGEHFQVLENASRHKALRLRLISEEIRKAFSDPDIRGVRIRSDLRFLVKRVQKWYEKYGAEVALPHPAVLSGEDMPDISLRPSPEQEKAIRTALTFPFTYIWGAPGTGKTRMVLASCVISCLKRGERVLVAAPTNNALEQTLFGLFPALEREGITLSGSAVRLGSPSDEFRDAYPGLCEYQALNGVTLKYNLEINLLEREQAELEKHPAKTEDQIAPGEKNVSRLSPTESSDFAEHLSAIKKRRRSLEDRLERIRMAPFPIMEVIDEFRLCAATMDGCIRCMFPGCGFDPDHVFLDEAGYCSLIKGLTLTAWHCPVTFLGDHMQLPPVFELDYRDIKAHPSLSLWALSALFADAAFHASAEDMASSLFTQSPPPFVSLVKCDLNQTHRFGPSLADVLARTIYSPLFRGDPDADTRILALHVRDPKRGKRRSPGEAAACARYLNLFPGESVGIITPYVGQLRLLRRSLKKMFDDASEDILTVHGSQGREWDTVIFSAVDTVDRYFTDSNRSVGRRVINTAVSRARKKLVIICDTDYWLRQKDQMLCHLIEQAEPLDLGRAMDDADAETDIY